MPDIYPIQDTKQFAQNHLLPLLRDLTRSTNAAQSREVACRFVKQHAQQPIDPSNTQFLGHLFSAEWRTMFEGNRYVSPVVSIQSRFSSQLNELAAILVELAMEPTDDCRNDAIRCCEDVLAKFRIKRDGHSPVANSKRVALYEPKDQPIVDGIMMPVLTKAQYEVVRALLIAGDGGLSKDALDKKSCHTDSRKILQRLCKNPCWAAVIPFPKKSHRKYRIL